jgi:hypothetical protein
VAWNNGFADMNAEDVALIFALPVLRHAAAHRHADGPWPIAIHSGPGSPSPLSSCPMGLAAAAVVGSAAVRLHQSRGDLLPGTGFAWLGLAFAGYAGLLFASRGSLRTAL